MNMQLKAMAKINLGLDVCARRPDGYHEVRMIMQTVCMYDRLTISTGDHSGVLLETDDRRLPADSRNLAVKAAELLKEEFGIRDGIHIQLEKRIPMAAGLAGGSSDAAAVLVGVNHLFCLGLSERELMQRGVGIGADVPYCIMRGTALAEGIGEKLTALPPVPDCHILLCRPNVRVSTKAVYQALDLQKVNRHPDIDGMIRAIEEGSLSGITERMENVLETVTVPQHPVIGSLKEKMLSMGAAGALMSGSGPTVYGIFENRENAQKAADLLRAEGFARNVFLTRPFQRRRQENVQ